MGISKTTKLPDILPSDGYRRILIQEMVTNLRVNTDVVKR